MNRIFHARVAIGQYLFLLLATAVTLHEMWMRHAVLTVLFMLLLVVAIERLIHTTYTLTADGRLVLYFGRFCREKGTGTLLEVCRSLPEIPFVFAGSGPMEEEVNKIPNVQNRGFLTGKELEDTIRKARFFIFPSEWYENCPFAVMEAQSLQTPVIASNLGGTSELVQNGETGELYAGGDQEQLRRKIQMLWEDRDRQKKYADNCRNAVFDSVEEYCGKLVDIYRE